YATTSCRCAKAAPTALTTCNGKPLPKQKTKIDQSAGRAACLTAFCRGLRSVPAGECLPLGQSGLFPVKRIVEELQGPSPGRACLRGRSTRPGPGLGNCHRSW